MDGSVASRVADAMERLANAQRRVVQDVATRYGLSPLQVQVLVTVEAGPPPVPRASALAAELGLTRPTVSDAVASLVAKHLLARHVDPDDRRSAVLELTGEGRRTASALASAGGAVAAAVAALPEREQEEVLVGLLRLIGALADAGVLGVARTCPTCRFFERRAGGDHCGLLDVALPPAQLRVNCPEHEPAEH